MSTLYTCGILLMLTDCYKYTRIVKEERNSLVQEEKTSNIKYGKLPGLVKQYMALLMRPYQ